jgi:hypothetical protein
MLGESEFPDWSRAAPARVTIVEAHQRVRVKHIGEPVNTRVVQDRRGVWFKITPGETLELDLSASMIMRLKAARRGRHTLNGLKRGPLQILDLPEDAPAEPAGD